MTYIRSLLNISKLDPEAVPVVHGLACRLAKGADQAGFYWMSSVQMIKESILPGLANEVPVPVNNEGTYPFFFKKELLTWDVIDMIAILPVRYRLSFLRVMRHFSALSSQAGRQIQWSEKTMDFKYEMSTSEFHWRKLESDIISAFGFKKKAHYRTRYGLNQGRKVNKSRMFIS